MTNTIRLNEKEILLAVMDYVIKRNNMENKFVLDKRMFSIGPNGREGDKLYFAEIEIDDIENAQIAGDP